MVEKDCETYIILGSNLLFPTEQKHHFSYCKCKWYPAIVDNGKTGILYKVTLLGDMIMR